MAEVGYAEFEDKEVQKFLRGMEKNLKEIKDGKKKYQGILSAIVYADVIRHFEKEEGSDGKWDPWSDIYKQRMQETGKGGNKILQDSGRMRNTFMPTKVRSTGSGLMWYNNAQTKSGFPYAYAHDEGGSKLPKRDFMWLSQDAMDNIAQQTLNFILENK
jgi:phage gpG-like protein